jgi:general secretion pathway protein C
MRPAFGFFIVFCALTAIAGSGHAAPATKAGAMSAKATTPGKATATVSAPASPSAQGRLPANAKLLADGPDAIRTVGKNAWRVDRRAVDEAMKNLNRFTGQIEVLPVNLRKDGQTDGFKVSSVRTPSVFSRIGLKNGDVLKYVNGMPLTGFDQVMQAYAKLRSAPAIQLSVLRGNRPVTLSYEIR